MKKYEKYKSVDLIWLNEVPEHWELLPIISVLSERKEKNYKNNSMRILSVLKDVGVMPYEQKGNIGNKFSEDISKYNLVLKDDIVINSMNIIIGSVGKSKYNGILSQVYYVLKNRNIKKTNIDYLEKVFKHKIFQEHFKIYGRGILEHRLKIPMEKLKRVRIPIPPFEEQKQIANYLDWKINEIDKLIEKEQIKLSNFNYLRKTLINTVVFQGLDKNKKIYRDIKLTWFKKTPYDWKQVKIKYIFSERVEKNHSEEQFLVSSQSMGVIPKKQYLTRTVEVLKDFHLLKLVKKGDFVISLRSFQGGIEYSDFQGIISPAYTILVLDKNVMLPMYFKYLGKTFDFIQLLKTCVTGIREGQNIDYSKLKNHVISIPTQQEQIDIVNYLDSNIKLIDKIILAYNNKIVLLNELKNSIISEVVTGKIDVRDVIIPKYEKLNVNQVGKEDSFKEGIENDDE